MRSFEQRCLGTEEEGATVRRIVPVPDARRRSASVLSRAPWLLGLALALAACGAPAVPPGLQLSLGATSIAIVRGATTDVQVDLTRLGGAAAAVELSVTGLPANVAAAFAPATLNGGVLTSTLTITVGAGATEATTALTVTATSGTLAADAALSLEVTSLTVVGRVLGLLSRPLVGATVGAQGETAFTDATGTFTLSGLSVPYDLAVSSALGDGGLHVYEGLTSATPLLRPTFARLTMPALALGTTVAGSLVGGALGANEAVLVCLEGLTAPVYGCDEAAAGDTGFSISAAWFDDGVAVLAARLHAFHVTIDADGVPIAFLGYETIAINLQDGLGVLADLDFDVVATSLLSGTATKPASLIEAVVLVSLRFGPNLSMALANVELLTPDFQVLVPDVAGATYDVVFGAGGPGAAVYTWKLGIGLDAGQLSVDVSAQPVAPDDAAVDVDLTTAFQTTAAGGAARTYVWEAAVNGPSIALTTTRTDVTVPDPASGGFAFPAGADYVWTVIGHGDGDADAAAAGGYTSFVDLITAINGGGPGLDGERTLGLIDAARDFTFAP
jgi:hypothetical protein